MHRRVGPVGSKGKAKGEEAKREEAKRGEAKWVTSFVDSCFLKAGGPRGEA